MPTTSPIVELVKYVRETALLGSIESVLHWDEQTMLPEAGSDYRAEQLSYLAGRVHERWLDPRFGDLLAAASQDPNAADPDGLAAATLRELKRRRDKRVKLPQALVEELSRAAVLGRQSWIEARKSDDFGRFAPALAHMLDLKRQEARCQGYVDSIYDPLLDDYEPGMKTVQAARVLDELRAALVPLVQAISAAGQQAPREILARHYPTAAQAAFAREVAAALGFDFTRGRLDVTAHPFCTTLGPRDVRILTRYDEHDLANALFGVIHEAGHGMYEQGLDPAEFGLPLGEAVSLGVHESQSRLWENCVGRSRAFWEWALPRARTHFPEALGNVTVDAIYFAVNDVHPSLIRTEADEATYNLHILVRFELERALLEERLSVAELPGAWRERYRDVVGIAPPNDADGVLQDIHWSAGLIGYFPTYSLGNLYAAQLFERASAELGNLETQLARGEFAPLLGWLRDKVHRHGQRWPAGELMNRAVGQPLSPEPLVRHLRRKFGPLYGLTA